MITGVLTVRVSYIRVDCCNCCNAGFRLLHAIPLLSRLPIRYQTSQQVAKTIAMPGSSLASWMLFQ